MRAWPSDFGPSWGPCGLDAQPQNHGCRADNFMSRMLAAGSRTRSGPRVPSRTLVESPGWWCLGARFTLDAPPAGHAVAPGARWSVHQAQGEGGAEEEGGESFRETASSTKLVFSRLRAGGHPGEHAGCWASVTSPSLSKRVPTPSAHRAIGPFQGPATRHQHPAHEVIGPATVVLGLDVQPTRPP